MNAPGHERPAWQAAFTFTALMLMGVLFRVASLPVRHPSLWIATGTIYVSLLVLLLVKSSSETVSTRVLACVVAVGVLQSSVANELIVREGVHVEPFIGAKLIALALALVAPPSLWVGVVALVATGLVPIAEFFHWPAEVRRAMPLTEPWTTLLYSAVAIGLLVHRRHQLSSQRRLVEAETRAAAFQLYMRKFLAVRDLASSPLQSIEMCVGTLRSRCPDAKPQLDRIERQVDRLACMTRALSRYEPVVWTKEDRSVDPRVILGVADELECRDATGGTRS
jgi:hypothetical protein